MTNNLLLALKQLFKRKGITYREAALALNLSEVSIKRIFSEQNTSLARLEKLCDFAKTDFGELMQLAEQARDKISNLTIEQEQELVSNQKLLLLGVCLINHWTFEDVLSKYQFEETELITLFAHMDRLHIIEYLPGNRYKLNIARDFSWQPNGPIHHYFSQSILNEYLSDSLSKTGNHLRFVWGMLSKQSVNELNQKIQILIEEYLHSAQEDVRIPINEKMTSSLMILFREEWEPTEFKAEHRD